MVDHTTPAAPPNSGDLFEIIRTTRSMRRLKADPVSNELIRKILDGGRLCAEWRQHATLALLGGA
jgi:hypothetical protein